jgi:hypothetical protein
MKMRIGSFVNSQLWPEKVQNLMPWLQHLGSAAALYIWWDADRDFTVFGWWLELCLCALLGGALAWNIGAALSAWLRPGDREDSPPLWSAWFKNLLRASSWAVIAGVLLLALISHLLGQQASQRVVDWYQANTLSGQTGFAGFFYDGPSWSLEPAHRWVSQGVDCNEKAYPFTKRNFYSTRHGAALKLESPREVEFRLASDDGSLLMVDGVRVIRHLGMHPATTKTARVRLSEGWHSIEVLHFQERGGSSVRLDMPPGLVQLAHPLKPDFDSKALWVLNKNAQNWANRTLALIVFAMLLTLMTLLPWPGNWTAASWAWIRRNWPLLAATFGLGLINSIGLNTWPGIDGDSAHHAIVSADLYWRANFNPSWSGYADQNLFTWPGYYLQHFFSLSNGMLRWYTSIGNLIGVLLMAVAVRQYFSRKTAMAVLLVTGFSALFFCVNRHFTEPFTYSFLGSGAALFFLALARKHWWAAPLCASSLYLLWQAHALWVPFIAGLGGFLFWMGGFKLFMSLRFWLGAATLLAWKYSWIIAYFTDGFGQPHYDFKLSYWWETVTNLAIYQLPGLLSGSRLVLYFAGENAWYILPVIPLLLLLCLGSWLFIKLPPQGRRMLWGLLILALINTMVMARVITLQEIRYALPLDLTLLLWLGVFCGQAMESTVRFRKLSALCVALLVAGGLYSYAAWLAPQMRVGGSCTDVPGAIFDSERMIDKREFYHALAKISRKVYFQHWDRYSMIFHELEDETGRLGMEFTGEEVPGGLNAFYRCSPGNKLHPKAEPVSLGERLDKNFTVYRIPQSAPKVK